MFGNAARLNLVTRSSQGPKRKGAVHNPWNADFGIAPAVASALENTQIGRFHTKGGHGFAAEGANALADRRLGRKVQVVGGNHAANGPDRIVNGVQVQTKYWQTAELTLRDAFDAQTGRYRYSGQLLEVPSDQYDQCLRLMREKIRKGCVPGTVDPEQAECLVREGAVTYKQARNIARAGTIDSLAFDAKSHVVMNSSVFAISFVVHFARCKWNGQKTPDALKAAGTDAIFSGATTMITGMAAAQVLRTRLAALGAVAARDGVRAVAATAPGRKAIHLIAQGALGRAVYGAAAVNHVSKLLRTNVITSTVVVALTATPDLYRAALARSISWQQFSKNLFVSLSGAGSAVASWMAGAAAGAALGSAIPVLGTAAGGVAGAILGLAGGCIGSAAAKAAMDRLMKDDAKQMLQFVESALEDLAVDYLLSDAEFDELIESVSKRVDAAWLRSLYIAGRGSHGDAARRAFAYAEFDAICLEITKKRETVTLPTPAEVQAQLEELENEVRGRAGYWSWWRNAARRWFLNRTRWVISCWSKIIGLRQCRVTVNGN